MPSAAALYGAFTVTTTPPATPALGSSSKIGSKADPLMSFSPVASERGAAGAERPVHVHRDRRPPEMEDVRPGDGEEQAKRHRCYPFDLSKI